ncbi:MAG: PepSY domain-containing protein, partial [Planctomycetes bacterium]|nr:PepSY domain-containing protein [Planctomycetota bacterium]
MMVRLIASLALFVGVVAQGKGWDELIPQVGLDLLKAIQKAEKEVSGGFVYHAELELDKGELVYSIDLAQGTASRNVVLDSKKGSIVENAPETDDLSAAVALCKIDLSRAVRAAQKERSGTVIEAQLGLPEGKPVYVVKIWAKGSMESIRIDGVSGKRLDRSAKPTAGDDEFTDRFPVQKSDLGPTGRNPYFILEPGYQLAYEGMDDGENVELVITVLAETKVVDGVTTRIVEERESEDGELVEISRNFFAISEKTSEVFYFGEEVDIYRDGKVAGHEGAWESGKGGARFGLMMPATPLLGARYYQEIAPDTAMDRAVIDSISATVTTPAGKFENCVRVKETTPLEPGALDHKYYAEGIGLIQDAEVKLIRHGRVNKWRYREGAPCRVDTSLASRFTRHQNPVGISPCSEPESSGHAPQRCPDAIPDQRSETRRAADAVVGPRRGHPPDHAAAEVRGGWSLQAQHRAPPRDSRSESLSSGGPVRGAVNGALRSGGVFGAPAGGAERGGAAMD